MVELQTVFHKCTLAVLPKAIRTYVPEWLTILITDAHDL